MKTMNVVLAGVGGQGVVSTSMVLAAAALQSGYDVKQSEVHGMAQRGGAVTSHVRFGSDPVYSAMVAEGGADIVLGFELLESLRNASYLARNGFMITSVESIRNEAQIPDYPQFEELLSRVQSFNHILIDSGRLARKAGSSKTQSAVMLGASSPYLGIDDSVYEGFVRTTFERKGDRIVSANLDAMRLGKTASRSYRALVSGGVRGEFLYVLARKLSFESEVDGASQIWAEVSKLGTARQISEMLLAFEKDMPVGAACAKRILDLASAKKLEPAALEKLVEEYSVRER